MVGTIALRGSAGKVMAPLKPGYFIEGKRRIIRVINVDGDENIPIQVREALRNINVVTIFTADELPDELSVPSGSVAAYTNELIEILRSKGKADAADHLQKVAGDGLSLYIFEPGTFEIEEE